MVEKLLSLARSDSGQNAMDMRPIDLRDTVRKVAGKWKSAVESKALEFTEMVTVADLPVEGDEAALQQLLNILLDNALKYTPGPGSVHLSAEESGGKAVLKVVDSGIGIILEDQARIFERFYRADKARSRELGGAGLGLAIAHGIVQQHHGSIHVESEPGKGSTFVVELPLQPAAVLRSCLLNLALT